MASRRELDDLEGIAGLRAHGLAQGWPIPRVVEAIVGRFGVSRLKAHRLARGWTRAQAVEEILATYDLDGCGWRPRLTCQRLCAWEHDPRVRPGEDYLDRLCRVYETRPDQHGYGHDYTPPAEQVAGDLPAEPPAAYAGAPAPPFAVVAGEDGGADLDAQSDSEGRPRTGSGFSKGWAQAVWLCCWIMPLKSRRSCLTVWRSPTPGR